MLIGTDARECFADGDVAGAVLDRVVRDGHVRGVALPLLRTSGAAVDVLVDGHAVADSGSRMATMALSYRSAHSRQVGIVPPCLGTSLEARGLGSRALLPRE